MNAVAERFHVHMTPHRVEWHLGNWAQWMSRGGGVRGYAEETPGVLSGNIASWADLCEENDAYAARATDAAVRTLTPLEQAAVSHVHLAAVWRFSREPMLTVYDRAVAALAIMLASRGLV